MVESERNFYMLMYSPNPCNNYNGASLKPGAPPGSLRGSNTLWVAGVQTPGSPVFVSKEMERLGLNWHSGRCGCPKQQLNVLTARP